ncbi:MAG: HAMP domain-containing protein [Alphaproteobacteria bacterium]|nr:MAG: HAMP domain-containing protein [Alphaproteobacteria bacterium]
MGTGASVPAAASSVLAADGGPVRRTLFLSPLMWRILAVNLLALAILAGGVLYLSGFRDNLIARRLDRLALEAETLAGAIGESAVGGPEMDRIEADAARRLIARLVAPSGNRARLFAADGTLLVDSRLLAGDGGVEAEPLPPLPTRRPKILRLVDRIEQRLARFGEDERLPLYVEKSHQRAADYPEVLSALIGVADQRLRRLPEGGLMLSAAAPVQRFRRVLGAVMLTTDSHDIDALLRAEQYKILKVFLLAITITLALSVYLAASIVRPIQRLSRAAERIRFGASRADAIPADPRRRDELGVLSRTLAQMTQTLYRQIDAIEQFAADVAHELKNPLSSLRSASEALSKARDAATRRRLLAIIGEDVRRIDRLISDISDASRLDAELTRAEMTSLDLAALLETTVSAYRDRIAREQDLGRGREVDLFFEADRRAREAARIRGLEGRLAQVFANLIDNAISFSPEGGKVTVRLEADGERTRILVEDEGPGLPEGAAEKIFARFYSERPEGEAFGTHSGLGLAIARQIVEAHGGRIRAENREDGPGARFIVELPRG